MRPRRSRVDTRIRAPKCLVANGVTLIDDTGPDVFKKVKDGARVRVHNSGVYAGDRRLIVGTERDDVEISELMHEAKSGLVAHLEAFAGNTIEFIRSESPLLIDGIGIPDIDVDVNRRHVVIVAEEDSAADDLKSLKPFIKEYQPVLIGVGAGADVLRKAGYRPQLIVGDPDKMSADVLRCGAQVVLPADADGHAAGLDRIQDLGVGAMTFPAAGAAIDLALLLADHHGAALDRHRGAHGDHRRVLRPHPGTQQPVDLPHPAQSRPETGRRQGRRHPVPQQGLRRRDRDARAGNAGCDHRRVVGRARRSRRAGLDRQLLEPIPALGSSTRQLGHPRDHPASACDFTRRGVSGARRRRRPGLGAAVRHPAVRIARRKRQLQNHINELDQNNNALNEKLNAADQFDASMAPRIVHGALNEKSVVIFRTPDASDDEVTSAGTAGRRRRRHSDRHCRIDTTVRRRQRRRKAACRW